ncbi:MAG: SPASM domain-containing protein, partial [Candidatus Saccharibacteria bacterium]|nr:SPASM domain-containing protein [Candidatus Saccharibacteria bacterium]
ESEYFSVQKDKPIHCSTLSETVTVMANGDVVACCYDLVGANVFGNIYEESIFNIYKSDRYKKFRDDFRSGIYVKPCTECVVVNPRYPRSV